MQFCTSMVVLISILGNLSSSQASNTAIVGYEPDTNVADRADIDLDQKDIQDYLAESPPKFDDAQTRYTN